MKVDKKQMSSLAKAGVSTEQIQQLVTEATNTRYGNFQEAGAIKSFQDLSGKKVASGQCRLSYNVGDINGIEWTLVGKIDGLSENGEVIEIKNRVKKLFGKLRDYEEPQIRTYMWLHKADVGYMIENLRSSSGNKLGIIKVETSDKPSYFEDALLPALIKFGQFFSVFINTPAMKDALMSGDEAGLYKAYTEFTIDE